MTKGEGRHNKEACVSLCVCVRARARAHAFLVGINCEKVCNLDFCVDYEDYVVL